MNTVSWDTTPQQKAEANFRRNYRKGAEDALSECLAAYYDTDSEKDPDMLMRERVEALLLAEQEKKG